MMSFHFISHQVISSRIKSYHIVSYHVMSYHITYHILVLSPILVPTIRLHVALPNYDQTVSPQNVWTSGCMKWKGFDQTWVSGLINLVELAEFHVFEGRKKRCGNHSWTSNPLNAKLIGVNKVVHLLGVGIEGIAARNNPINASADFWIACPLSLQCRWDSGKAEWLQMWHGLPHESVEVNISKKEAAAFSKDDVDDSSSKLGSSSEFILRPWRR